MAAGWACPECKRRFTRKNQRHACGTGDREALVKNRPPEVVAMFRALEALAKKLGPVELVTRDKYVLLRSKRIFADAVLMTDALRLAIHLGREVKGDFIKVVADERHVTHVAKLRSVDELARLTALLGEAYEFSLR